MISLYSLRTFAAEKNRLVPAARAEPLVVFRRPMINLVETILCVAVLLSAGRACAMQATQSLATFSPASIGPLFEEEILAANSCAVRAQAAGLTDETRFDRLLSWVLPSRSHTTIRMAGDFTQTNPAPVSRIDSSEEHTPGGRIVSPVFDLLDVAKRSNRLADLLKMVDAVPEHTAEEQQRAKAALQTLLHLELGNTDEAVKAVDRLSQLVRTSDANEISEMWPETLVVYRCVIRKVTAPGIDDLLAFLFAQRTQRDVPVNALVWHSQIAALAGQNGHREVGPPFDAGGECMPQRGISGFPGTPSFLRPSSCPLPPTCEAGIRIMKCRPVLREQFGNTCGKTVRRARSWVIPAHHTDRSARVCWRTSGLWIQSDLWSTNSSASLAGRKFILLSIEWCSVCRPMEFASTG